MTTTIYMQRALTASHQTVRDLQAALATATSVEAIPIMQMLAAAAEMPPRIDQLITAMKETT